MKPEILAPVGNVDHLQAALAAGCDAVYFALPDFSARAFAKNFTYQQAKEAIDQCHLLGVKVYITMNTILFEEEIEQAYLQAKKCYEMGADALIVQDLGLMYLIHTRLPEAEIHASTQVSITTPQQIQQLKSLGVKRVVLARECSKEMVQQCKEAGLEIEIFIHGAICVSMSGRCLFSSFKYKRSGNRGQCAQPCRMQYDLLKDGQKISTQGSYLLSPKDLSMIDEVKDLNVDSVKIEGRMKSVEYVYESVAQTRKVLDGYSRNQEDQTQLQTAFYRGYTKGHYFQERGKDFINQESCNHIGVAIGKVLSVNKDKITILCQEELYQHDGIRFENKSGCILNYLYDEKGKLQNRIQAGKTAKVDTIEDVKKGDIVYRTLSVQLQSEVQTRIKETVRKIGVSIQLRCKGVNHPLEATLSDGIHSVSVQSTDLAQPAQKQPLNQETLIKQFSKTKNSWVEFSFDSIELADGLFFTMGALNQFRRDCIEVLEKKRIEVKSLEEKEDEISIHVDPFYGVYTELDSSIANQDWNLTNAYAMIAAIHMGYKALYISEECEDDQIRSMLDTFETVTGQKAPVIKMVYGHHRFMVMNHCPINTNLSDGQRKNCSMCHNNRYELKGKDGSRIWMEGNFQCQMELFDSQVMDALEQVKTYKEWGIEAFYIHPQFLDENKVNSLVEKVKEL